MTGDALTAEVLALTRRLVERPSVSPDDCGCQGILGERLRAAGFAVESMRFGAVDNFWAVYPGGGTPSDRVWDPAEPRVVFAGHTDVVPSGPEEAWTSPPFEPTERDGFLYGRGTADMKSSLAAMVTAVERFVRNHPRPAGTVALLITSDEEADAVDGTVRVVEELARRRIGIDYCVVGEPSSATRLGDVIRIGVQGHVAYPDKVVNPIHPTATALNDLVATTWDTGDADFPPTSFQVSNINAGTGATNVVPGELECAFNFRFNPQQTPGDLLAAVEKAFVDAEADCEFDWSLSGMPFITQEGKLLEAVRKSIAAVAGVDTETSTSGGTSDGRFIAPTGAEVVELGPVNDTIHKVDERVAIGDLAPLSRMYEQILERLLLH